MEMAVHEIEKLEESGALEADTGAQFDEQLANINPLVNTKRDARAHRPLRPEQMVIRDELRQAKRQTLAVRRVALRKLLLHDFMQEERQLRALGLAYARPGP